MNSRHPLRHRAQGFTLIELMVALGVFMVLGLLSYRALASIIDSRDRLMLEQQRWLSLTRFMQRLELDLQQIPRTFPDGLVYDANRKTLRLIRLVAGPMGDEVRTVRYRWLDGVIERDERKLLAPVLSKDLAAWADAEKALESVQLVEWQWSAGQRTDSPEMAWQAPPVSAGTAPPSALRLRIQLGSVPGDVVRVFVLR
jgi:general secretion pathway protein J